jgi:hypothetical protein
MNGSFTHLQKIQFSVGLFFQAGSFRPQCGSSS